jgi:hypothetical protein
VGADGRGRGHDRGRVAASEVTVRAILLLSLSACTGEPYVLDTGDPVDTGVPECGRIRGTEAIVMYQEGGDATRTPLETAATPISATGVAGPLGDDRTYVTVVDGRAAQSVDGGCNWDDVGTLPESEWSLVGAGARVYAFDRASASMSRSDDLGLSWDALDSGEVFIGLPSVDPANAEHLRGLQARGVVDSTDGGTTWTAGAALPAELSAPTSGAVYAAALDTAVVGGSSGGWRTTDAGNSWTPILTDAVVALAIHPDDPLSLFSHTVDGGGVRTLSRSTDGGGAWARQVDSSQIELTDASVLWPVPGNPAQALSTAGPVYNENTASDGLNLYILTAGEGTATRFVGGWYHIHQITFGADRWVAAVDAVNP